MYIMYIVLIMLEKIKLDLILIKVMQYIILSIT